MDEPLAGRLATAAAWLLGAALILPALSFWPFRHHPPAITALEWVTFLIPALAAMLLLALVADPRRLAVSPALLLAAALGLWAVLSASVSAWPATAWRGAVRWLVLGLFAWACAAALSRARHARTAMTAVSLAAALLSVLYLVQLASVRLTGSDPLGMTLSGTTDLPSATFVNRNQLATYLLFALPVPLLAAAASGASRSKRAMGAALAALVVLALVLTRTEGAMVGCLASACVLGGFGIPVGLRIAGLVRLSSRLLLVLILAGGAAGVLVIAAGGSGAASHLPRLATMVERAALWDLAWKAAAEKPVAGHGPRTFDLLVRERQGAYASQPAWEGVVFLSRHAHDDWLEAASTMGWPAAILMAAVFTAALAAGWKTLRASDGERARVSLAVAAGLTGVLVHALVHYPLQVPTAAALAFGGAGILAGLRMDEPPLRAGARPLALLLAGPPLAVVLLLALADLRAGVALDAALGLGEEGRLEESARNFERATRLRPDWSTPWTGLGAVRLLQGDPVGARKVLERARRLAPGDPDVLANLAGADELEGRSSRALALYGEALEGNPRHLPSLIGSARLLAAAGEDREAADAWRRVLSVDPRNAMALRGLAALGEQGPDPLTP